MSNVSPWLEPLAPEAKRKLHAEAKQRHAERNKKPTAAEKKAHAPKVIELHGGPRDGKSLRVRHDLDEPIMLDLGRARYVRRRGTQEWHYEEPPCPPAS